MVKAAKEMAADIGSATAKLGETTEEKKLSEKATDRAKDVAAKVANEVMKKLDTAVTFPVFPR